jgi:hypothetical protein
MKNIFLLFCAISLSISISSQKKFAQLDQELPSPNDYRTASGAPGHGYYQQKADYKMNLTIDDATQKMYGIETLLFMATIGSKHLQSRF